MSLEAVLEGPPAHELDGCEPAMGRMGFDAQGFNNDNPDMVFRWFEELVAMHGTRHIRRHDLHRATATLLVADRAPLEEATSSA